jgi:anti-sigma28 factor (negative regulator of flagellin synthesis)
MQGPEFHRLIQSDIASSKVRDNLTVDKKTAERQSKLAELKERVQSGKYQVDTMAVAKRIQESGVLADE